MLAAENIKGFARFSRNPLSIIALFIVLIYGVAGYVASSANLNVYSQMILATFLFVFPFFVLWSFHILVSSHFFKLFGPEDMGSADYARIVGAYLPQQSRQEDEAIEDTTSVLRDATAPEEDPIARFIAQLSDLEKSALLFNANWASRENLRKRNRFKSLLRDSADIDKVLSTEQNRNIVFDILNMLDALATEIYEKKFDTEDAKRQYKVAFSLYWPKARRVIEKLRSETNRTDVYQNLVRLADEWVGSDD